MFQRLAIMHLREEGHEYAAADHSIDQHWNAMVQHYAENWDGTPEHATQLRKNYQRQITRKKYTPEQIEASVHRTSPESYASTQLIPQGMVKNHAQFFAELATRKGNYLHRQRQQFADF